MSRSRLGRAVVPAAKASKSTKASAKKPAAVKAKTSNSPSAWKGVPRKARKPAMLAKCGGRSSGYTLTSSIVMLSYLHDETDATKKAAR